MAEIPEEHLTRVASERGYSLVPRQLQAVSGRPGAPAVVLIHGHAVTKLSWTNPYAESLADGTLTFDLALGDTNAPPREPFLPEGVSLPGLSFSTPLRLLPQRPQSMWDFLAARGCNLITWTQASPNGSHRIAFEELDVVVRLARREFPHAPIILLAHSRGGLVARKYVQERAGDVPGLEKLILLGCPNGGSALAAAVHGYVCAFRVARLLARWSYRHVAKKVGLTPRELMGRMDPHFRRFADFVTGEAIEEMRPGSALLTALEANEHLEKNSRISYVTVSGSSTLYTRIYAANEQGKDFEELASIFGGLPEFLVPDELTSGKGDGLVSVRRSRLPWVEDRILPVTHASMLIDPDVKDVVRTACGLP